MFTKDDVKYIPVAHGDGNGNMSYYPCVRLVEKNLLQPDFYDTYQIKRNEILFVNNKPWYEVKHLEQRMNKKAFDYQSRVGYKAELLMPNGRELPDDIDCFTTDVDSIIKGLNRGYLAKDDRAFHARGENGAYFEGKDVVLTVNFTAGYPYVNDPWLPKLKHKSELYDSYDECVEACETLTRRWEKEQAMSDKDWSIREARKYLNVKLSHNTELVEKYMAEFCKLPNVENMELFYVNDKVKYKNFYNAAEWGYLEI